MKIYFYILLSVAISSAFCGCKKNSDKTKNLTKEISFQKDGELILKKAKTDSVLAKLDIEIADDDYATQTGLMYRHSMPKNQAMLFIFPEEGSRSFYMKNTEFPLDIIYIDKDKKVISIQKNAVPYDEKSLPAGAASMYVLEVNAGLTDAWNLEKGDVVNW